MISQMGMNSNCIRLHRGFVWRNPLEHPFRRNTTHMVPAHPSHLPASSVHLHQASVENHRSHTSHCQNQERVHDYRNSLRTFHNIYICTSHLLLTISNIFFSSSSISYLLFDIEFLPKFLLTASM